MVSLEEQPPAHQDLVQQFRTDGYCLVSGVFSAAEVAVLRDKFMELAHQLELTPEEEAAAVEDPLLRYPRNLHPHRQHQFAREAMLHPRVLEILRALFGTDPVATQSMFYYKPPGARGQAMHQDNFYLLVEPGTCVAAWTAIDDCDLENGCMFVAPRTGDLPVVCSPKIADARESFTSQLVPVPKGHKAVPCLMKAGDTLFFNGSTIHGSGPNRTKDRFRRAFISHYAAGNLERISHHYMPLVRTDGSEFNVEAGTGGSICGEEWKDSPWRGAVH